MNGGESSMGCFFEPNLLFGWAAVVQSEHWTDWKRYFIGDTSLEKIKSQQVSPCKTQNLKECSLTVEQLALSSKEHSLDHGIKEHSFEQSLSSHPDGDSVAVRSDESVSPVHQPVSAKQTAHSVESCLLCFSSFSPQWLDPEDRVVDNCCCQCNELLLKTCQVCALGHASVADRSLHTKVCHPTFCFVCQQKWPTVEQARSHTRDCIRKAVSKRKSIFAKTQYDTTASVLLRCSICDYSSEDVMAYQSHCVEDHDFTLCPLCPSTTQRLDRHLLSCHVLSLNCSVCGLYLEDTITRIFHSLEAHGDSVCAVCQTNANNVEAHVKYCWNELPPGLFHYFRHFRLCESCFRIVLEDHRCATVRF